jgi:hypothetical protein
MIYGLRMQRQKMRQSSAGENTARLIKFMKWLHNLGQGPGPHSRQRATMETVSNRRKNEDVGDGSIKHTAGTLELPQTSFQQT